MVLMSALFTRTQSLVEIGLQAKFFKKNTFPRFSVAPHTASPLPRSPLHNALACQNRKCDRLHGCAPFTSAIRDSPPRKNVRSPGLIPGSYPCSFSPSALLSTMHLATPAHQKHIRTCIQYTSTPAAGYGSCLRRSTPPRATHLKISSAALFLYRPFNFRAKLEFCQFKYARFSIRRYISARRSFFAFLCFLSSENL